ncbi:response regulator [Pedobacter sp. MC2016-05]|uniref:hybrid sensor histidine kinase/response regulator transcription factor n=1 Tax=Pedobacter sp. MC2016-05 TaxID=2994474 RepID=UPI002246D8F6|nr:two-component regulator propeller domain-containing protein [Pedobacter sp. MC2016-05]MCX2476878.1 response regulator [Pedobacter sp. MC2016-05]
MNKKIHKSFINRLKDCGFLSGLILVLLLHLSALSFAQEGKTKYLSLQDGLSNQQVLDVVHDHDGFIWVATELGLNRFSSNSFKHFYKAEKPDGKSVNSSEINTLLYDNQKLYIGTRSDGLNVLDLKTNTFSYFVHHPKDEGSISTNDITDIIKSKNGKLWLATFHQGVQQFNTASKKFLHFNQKSVLAMPENSVWSLAEDKNGLLYIGHVNKGVSILNPATKELQLLDVKTTGGILPDNEVKSLFCDSKNNIWIGTRKGLAVYNPVSKKLNQVKLRSKSIKRNEPFIFSIKEVQHQIWVGAESSQLFALTPNFNINNDEISYSVSLPLALTHGSNTSVQNIDQDQFGNVWLAIYSGGLAFSSHLKPFFSILPQQESSSERNKTATVTAVINDQQNKTLLATTGEGILQIDNNGRVDHINANNSLLGDDFLLSGFEDESGNKWFGLQKGGVSCYQPASNSWKKIDGGKRMSEVRAIMQDSRKNICFAAQEGLFILAQEIDTLRKITITTPMMGDFSPRTLVEDHLGNMWVGTYGQGIYIYDRNWKLIKRVSKAEGLVSNTINHVYRDSENTIWIATNEGLSYQSSGNQLGKIETLPLHLGDAWLTINSITESPKGNIWCATKLGLIRYLPAQKRLLSYDQAFGLPLGGFINNSVSKDKNGRLFFGMPSGACYFDPVNIPLKLPSSPINISRLMVFNTDERRAQTEKFPDAEKRIHLKHGENSFRIELAVMDYAMNDLLEFSYKLQGFDNKWISLGDEKNIDFRSIPYGSYELKIRTRQKNEQWSEDYESLHITIKPPFYLSILAIAFYIVVVLATVIAFFFFYIKRINAEAQLSLKKQQLEQEGNLHTERMNFYTNVTHELRTPLTLILGPLEDLLHENQLSPKHRERLSIVQKSATRLFSMVNQLLEFRKVESQHKPLALQPGFLRQLLEDIVQKYVEASQSKNINISLTANTEDFETIFDREIVQLIVDNLLSNACKHTKAGSVMVSLAYEQNSQGNWAVIKVKDTGSGIASAHLEKIFEKFYQVPQNTGDGAGVGLSLVKQLAAIHHGQVSVKSELDWGSEFCVRLLANPVSPQIPYLSEHDAVLDEQKKPQVESLPMVLLVEDDVDLRAYLSTLLASKYNVITAENGKQGFQLAKSHVPDIIVSDLMMPEMDGFAMLQALKLERETSHIPTILLTAKSSETDKHRGYELGLDSYLTKPISTQLLYGRIDNLLSKRKSLYEEVLSQLSNQIKTTEVIAAEVEADPWRENDFVKEFANLVEKLMHQEVLDAATLAENMNMSQSTLYRKLKALTGKNINQLVRKVRMQKAAQLLDSGKYNINEVSFMVGINSSIYFRQCFKEEFGQLPSEYQKNKV